MKYYCNIIPNCALKKIESEAPTAKAEDSQALHDNIPFQI
jgi:hypothetical protein